MTTILCRNWRSGFPSGGRSRRRKPSSFCGFRKAALKLAFRFPVRKPPSLESKFLASCGFWHFDFRNSERFAFQIRKRGGQNSESAFRELRKFWRSRPRGEFAYDFGKFRLSRFAGRRPGILSRPNRLARSPLQSFRVRDGSRIAVRTWPRQNSAANFASSQKRGQG